MTEPIWQIPPAPEPRAMLFLGGPWDGQVRAMESIPHTLKVPEVDTFRLFSLAQEEPVRVEEATISVTLYRHDRLALFGAILSAYVDEDLTPSERDARAREWLLSPLAKGLLS